MYCIQYILLKCLNTDDTRYLIKCLNIDAIQHLLIKCLNIEDSLYAQQIYFSVRIFLSPVIVI